MIKSASMSTLVGAKVQHLDSSVIGEIIEVVSSNGWRVVDVLWERPFFGHLITTELITDLVEYERAAE